MKTVLLAVTRSRFPTRESAWMMLSVTPSLRYSMSGSSLVFANGMTAMVLMRDDNGVLSTRDFRDGARTSLVASRKASRSASATERMESKRASGRFSRHLRTTSRSDVVTCGGSAAGGE